ncbi:hypothetical protein SISNIDRAFT_485934 [Sistotremastrum niveocremeum HHB9708]|uniref:Uncharacterized protein n=1 Tax=Sistotremastrum niveocremeum HHB9708 TaxID=1314777 RepID=A0A164U7I8_9AGAM|nr:hypothetical protein SISNIDRAFT_485934 [Sistotremastrum niveocremeum HHB9708]
MSLLPDDLIRLVLPHLLPPSHRPLPDNLISLPLRQRHRFLALVPDDPDYLIWPSPNSDAVLAHLTSSTTPIVDASAAVYSADKSLLRAHLPVDDTLQLIFHFHPDDESSPWKYHDAQLLPLPPNTHISPDKALATLTMDTSDDENSVSPEDYWAGYASSTPSSPPAQTLLLPEPRFSGSETKEEQQYWARYSSIQGSGDSTVPSPRPARARSPRPASQEPAQPEPVPLQPPTHDQIARVLINFPDTIQEQTRSKSEQTDGFARDAIAGIYKLWKASHQSSAGKEEFFSLVQSTLDSTSE